jgi:hypothetical protein
VRLCVRIPSQAQPSALTNGHPLPTRPLSTLRLCRGQAAGAPAGTQGDAEAAPTAAAAPRLAVRDDLPESVSLGGGARPQGGGVGGFLKDTLKARGV